MRLYFVDLQELCSINVGAWDSSQKCAPLKSKVITTMSTNQVDEEIEEATCSYSVFALTQVLGVPIQMAVGKSLIFNRCLLHPD